MVEDGDEMRFEIKAIPQLNNVSWEWNTSVYRKGKKITGFSQSNLYISKKELIIGRTSFKPVLTHKGEIHRRVLGLCDGKSSMEKISEIIHEEYPEKFGSIKDAMRRVIGIIRSVVLIK